MIGTIVLASLVSLVLLQSSNLWKDFSIESSSDLLFLYALSGLNFAALIIFGFIFLRSIIKLNRERRTFQMGAQIKTRLLIYFFAVSLMPIIAMAVFSYLFMNRALDRWFTQIPDKVIRETREMQDQSLIDRSRRLDETVRMLATAIDKNDLNIEELAKVGEAGNLVHVSILSADHKSLVSYDRAVTAEERPELDRLLAAAKAGNASEPELRDGRGFDVAMTALSGGRTLVVVPDPFGERTFSKVVDNSFIAFDRLKERQVTIRQQGLLTLGVLTFLVIFASTWVAFYVARGLTAPIKALAEGADEIARGNLGHRVDVFAEDELALLVATFNDMSTKLESNSVELSERRRYIETVLETLPTGVISFDSSDKITTINGAAKSILKLETTDFSSAKLNDILTDDNRAIIERLLGRARRVGHASDQTMLKDDGTNGNGQFHPELTVALTATQLPTDGGVVLVIEDLSELIAAQRASAWQEVARRMAHEIKNPLTPIQLSAERIAKRFDLSGFDDSGLGKRANDHDLLGDVVHQSTETILREVSSLKMMVDEFSQFARLPEVALRPGDIVEVIRQSVATFEGRFKNVDIAFAENGALPEIMQDGEQLKRVFVNLIDNAVEAFEPEQSEKSVTITARHEVARDLIVAEVTDNGKGIAPSDLQKLFQPYFSTKGRGTGLGLAIVKRIILEHHGRINVVTNSPHGAKFIIELPVT